MATSTRIFIGLQLGILAGCTYQENLPEVDLDGVVRISKEAATVTLEDPETGEERTITDPRAIGPVYIGAFASVRSTDFGFPHPEMGPIVGDQPAGNTYPYGGTSLGRFDWACYEVLRCKVVTGRYSSFDDLLGFFEDELQDPITDPFGEEVTGAEAFRERCYDVLYITSDEELNWLAREPDFVDMGDYYEADVEMLHVTYVEDMAIWAFIDMPSVSFDFTTCDPNDGIYFSRYSEAYYEGTNQIDVLNFPKTYITNGDLLVEEPWLMSAPDETFEIDVGYKYED